jgi:hypothetical protein
MGALFDAWLDGEVARMGPMTPSEEARFRRAVSRTMAARFVRLEDRLDEATWPFRLIVRFRLRRIRAKIQSLRDEGLER